MTAGRTIRRLADGFFAAAILASPCIGVGTLRLLTGRDLGAGFQPAYLLIFAASVLALAGYGPGRCARSCGLAGRGSAVAVLTAAALAASVSGLVLAPAGVTFAQALLRFFKQVIQLAVMILFVLYPLLWLRRPERWRMLGLLLGIALLGQVIYSVVQAGHFYFDWNFFASVEGCFTSNPAILSGSEELYLGDVFRGIPRLRGTACEPLYLGNWLLLALPWLLLYPWPRRQGRLLKAIGVAGLVLLVATWSRGAWLGAAVACLVAMVLARRRGPWRHWKRWAVAVAAVGAAGAGVVLVVWGSDALMMPWHRLQQSVDRSDWSNLTRLYSMQAAWRAFLLSPVVGIGWGQFGFHFAALVDPMGLQSQFAWPVVNNFPLQVLCESGLAGFAVLCWGGALLLRRVWRRGRDGGEAGARIMVAAVAVAGISGQLLTFSQYNLPHIWVALGVLLAALKDPDEAGRDLSPAGDAAAGGA